jgi:hypothetical protein
MSRTLPANRIGDILSSHCVMVARSCCVMCILMVHGKSRKMDRRLTTWLKVSKNPIHWHIRTTFYSLRYTIFSPSPASANGFTRPILLIISLIRCKFAGSFLSLTRKVCTRSLVFIGPLAKNCLISSSVTTPSSTIFGDTSSTRI